MKIYAQNEIIPIFFAVDDNYAPYLSVSLISLIENADRRRFYDIYILHSGISSSTLDTIRSLAKDNCRISGYDMRDKIKNIMHRLHLRDYYSVATYLRLFVADLFPCYDKAIYLDSDTVITGDIARLYDKELGKNLVAAVPDDVMAEHKCFGDYAKYVVGVPVSQYFNAGILLMNLKAFRDENIEGQFLSLLSRKKYEVTQDQDYLNRLCLGRTLILGCEWNQSPAEYFFCFGMPSIIHFKLHLKPWKYDNIKFSSVFWHYASLSPFYDRILAEKASVTEKDKEKDRIAYLKLEQMALDCTAPYKEEEEQEYLPIHALAI